MVFDGRPEIRTVLADLHAQASGDAQRWQERTGSGDAAHNAAGGGDLVRLGEFYLSVTPDQGNLLYLLARATGARRIVEFGASFGISSIYLAAAAQDNGGTLTTTEVHPDKCAALRRTFARAGLSDVVTLLEGDARETLRTVQGPVDLLFLDGWKGLYLPVFDLMRPKLRTGAMILADNCAHPAAGDYVARVSSPGSGCVTVTRDDLAISCITS